MGAQGGGEGVDGEGVLALVLARCHELGADVVAAVAGPDGAGEDPGGHGVALAAQQQLGGGTDEPVDAVGPARGVVVGEAGEEEPGVEGFVGDGEQVVGEGGLVELAGLHAGDGLGDGPAVAGDGHVAVVVVQGSAGADGHGAAHGCGDAVAGELGDPGVAVAAADDDPGHDEHGAGRAVGEGEAGEGDGPGAGELQVVTDVEACGEGAPPGVGLGEPARAGAGEAGDLAPADEAFAVAHPGEGTVVGQQVEETAHVVHRAGPHSQRRRGRCDGHIVRG